jgi:pyruvate/2-oxoglutarate dehydrogenase complex dihydrolipoamide acyltransferase (E2) component
MGTASISTAGMNDASSGIPSATPATLMRTVGGVDDKRVIVDDHTSVRVYLSHTISADHDIVDDAPAVRFTERFKELIERGYGLDERLSRV